jgi:hypothetical protein
MTDEQDRAAAPFAFQVALQGSFGPALRAVFMAMGVQQIRTTSSFLVPVQDGEGICEIVEALESRGLKILDVRPAARGTTEGP